MSTPANSIAVTVNQLVLAALQEIGALSPGEQPSPDDSATVLQKLQRLIDRFNAKRTMIYNIEFTVYTLPVNVQPVTIGPGAMFDCNQRPVEIRSMSLILNSTSPTQVEIPINMRDDAWWAEQRVKNLTSTLPTDCYYSPDWGNGNLYFWPIPTQVNQVRIESRGVLGEYTGYTQAFSLPPGYWDAIVYSLAISLGPMYEKPISPDLAKLWAEAIRTIESNNIKSPRGTTGDAGMPGVGRRGDFNYYSGGPNQ